MAVYRKKRLESVMGSNNEKYTPFQPSFFPVVLLALAGTGVICPFFGWNLPVPQNFIAIVVGVVCCVLFFVLLRIRRGRQ